MLPEKFSRALSAGVILYLSTACGMETTSAAGLETATTGRNLLVRSRNREGRRFHNLAAETAKFNLSKRASKGNEQQSWEWEKSRTLYFEPVAGLGNRLRALASAVVLAREAGVGLKVVWREEVECGADCGHAPPFNSTWEDLFSYPNLRTAPNFPGSNYSVHLENVWLMKDVHIIHPGMPPIIPGYNCSVFFARNYSHFKDLLYGNEWTTVHGEEVLCVKSDLWLTKNGEADGRFFFRLLQPSPPVKALMDTYKKSLGWDDKHFVGVHIRRGDLTITTAEGKKGINTMVPLSRYVDALRKLTSLAPKTLGVNYFIATDDPEAEKIMRSSFEDGLVWTYPKTAWSRSTVEGIQQALVDVLLLAECPVLLGTYYSSYSEAAKLIGWPFFIQIGNELQHVSQETTFEGWSASQ